MKKTIFILTLFISLTSILSFAQDHKNHAEPEWVKTSQVTGFSWGYDIIYDKKGNAYATGYVRRQIAESDTTFGPLPCPKGISCQDITFLSKRNQKGELLWRQYIYGSTRVLQLALDKSGHVNMIGSSYSQGIGLSSEGDETIILESGKNSSSKGFFMCKYDENGILKQSKIYNNGKNPRPLTFLIDDKENLYIGGHTEYRPHDKPAEPHPSYLFLKFDKNWNLQWEMSGDTIGRSSIISMAYDNKSNIIFSGMYEKYLNLGEERKIDDYHQKPFVGKISEEGKIKWISEEISQYGNGVAFDVACDSKGNTYVTVNTSYSYAFLTKVNQKGKKEWMHKIERSVKFEDLIVTENDEIFVCGQGYGSTFPSTNSISYSYQPKGGTGCVLAEYDTKGVLKWLKSFGDKGTNYCRSMAVNGNKVIAFGSYNNSLNFGNIKTPRGLHFWYAEFDLKKLRETSTKTSAIVEKPLSIIPVNTDCSCKQELTRPNFAPPIYDLTNYEDIEALSEGWKYAGKENFYDKLFFKGFNKQGNRASSVTTMTLLTVKPMSLMHPDKTIAINLSPCESNQNYKEVPIRLSYKVPIKRMKPAFDIKKFGKTTKEYLEVLASHFTFSHNQLLEKVIFKGDLKNIENFVNDINANYGLSLQTNFENEKVFIDELVQALRKKGINHYDFVLNEFILEEKTKHLITKSEKDKLMNIFGLRRYGHDFDEIVNGIIYPSVSIRFEVKKIGVDIHTNIIRRWDNVKNEPLIKDKKPVKSHILLDVPEVAFNTGEGFTTQISKACTSNSEITGTNILFDFSKLKLEIEPIDMYSFLNNAQRRITQGSSPTAKNTKPLTDDLLEGFSGLNISNPKYTFSFKGNKLVVNGNGLLVNNKILIGSMNLPVKNFDGEQIILQINNQEIATTYSVLKSFFESKKFDAVQLIHQGSNILVEFKKVNW